MVISTSMANLQQNEIDYLINLARNGLSNHIQGLNEQIVTVAEIISGFSEKSSLIKKFECVVTITDPDNNFISQADTIGSKYPLYKNILTATIAAGKNVAMSQINSIHLIIDIVTGKRAIRTISEIDESIDALLISSLSHNESRLYMPGNKFKSRASLLITQYTRIEKLTLFQIKG